MKKSIVEIVLAIIFVLCVIEAANMVTLLSRTTTIHNYATIKAVGVAFFRDSAATQPATNITWGLVSPGMTYNTTLYCENIKTANVTMTLTVGNWNPANASAYLSPGWNYTGTLLTVRQIIPIKFTLQVFSNVTSSGITNFAFTYNVTAAG